jgi:hypothetical protein
MDCGDLNEENACIDAGCTWNSGQGRCK